MIDRDIIESLPDSMKQLAKESLANLAGTEIVSLQVNREIERIIVGDSDEDPQALAQSILLFRRRSQALVEFQQLCEQYKKELL